MKKSTLALVVMGIVASASVQAAEIYNKDGNKLDVYGKVKAMHYMSDNDSKDGDQSYIRFGFKGETQINDQLTGYGRWEAEFAGNKAESDTAQQKTRLAFAGLKYKDLGSFPTELSGWEGLAAPWPAPWRKPERKFWCWIRMRRRSGGCAAIRSTPTWCEISRRRRCRRRESKIAIR